MSGKGTCLCLVSLVILLARMGSPLPQGVNNFGWPAMQPNFPQQQIQQTGFVSDPSLSNPAPQMFAATPLTSVASNAEAVVGSSTTKAKSASKEITLESIPNVQQNISQPQSKMDLETSVALKTTPNPKVGMFSKEAIQYLTTGMAAVAGALGHDGCYLKAACLAGNLIPNVQGRDLAVSFAESLVPGKWKDVVQAAKSSMLQGQDCSRFSCL